MADLYSEGRLKMTKKAFFATLSLNIFKTASKTILQFSTVLEGIYSYHHAKFQVNRCNFVDARGKKPPFLRVLPHAMLCHFRCGRGIDTKFGTR